jgi:hypothetical protein
MQLHGISSVSFATLFFTSAMEKHVSINLSASLIALNFLCQTKRVELQSNRGIQFG